MRIVNYSALALALIYMTLLIGQCYGQLKQNYYQTSERKCDNVEGFVADVVKKLYKDGDAAAMLRMLFHDCFVEGCDASILINGNNTEKTAGPNKTVRRYDLIDDVKSALEMKCPGVVSCADIIVMVTRVTLNLASKGAIWYPIETGRWDGKKSEDSEAIRNLPPPNVPIPMAIAIFKAKELTVEDFVYLMGGHTVGFANCANVRQDYPGFMDKCGMTTNNPIPLDKNTSSIVDNEFYKAILDHYGALQVDSDLAFDPTTSDLVERLASDKDLFNRNFGKALNRMAKIGVKTSYDGEIRSKCSVVNSPLN